MGEIIETPRADQSAGDRTRPASIGFRGVGDHARLDQIDQAIADHARMDAEIAAILEQAQDRVGHRADPDLEHRAVLDVTGRDLGDRIDRSRRSGAGATSTGMRAT